MFISGQFLQSILKGVAHRPRSAVASRHVFKIRTHCFLCVYAHRRRHSAFVRIAQQRLGTLFKFLPCHLHCSILNNIICVSLLLIHYTKIPLLLNTVHISFTAWIKCKHIYNQRNPFNLVYFSWDIFTDAKYYSIGLSNNCLSWLHSLSSVATYWIHQDTTVTTHFS